MLGRWSIPAVLLIGLLMPEAAEAKRALCQTADRREAQTQVQKNRGNADSLSRPETGLHVDNVQRGLRVHYGDASQEELATELLGFLENAWDRQVETLGYEPPPDDGQLGGNGFYDLYITSVANSGALTVSEGVATNEDGGRKTSFILFDASVSQGERALTIEHEFQHALQFGINARASLFLFEASAVYMETMAFPEQLAYTAVIADYQLRPNAPFFADGIQWQEVTGESIYYEYGGALFLMYLEQLHGDQDGRFVASLWQDAPSNLDPNRTADFLDVLESKGVDLRDSVLDFATWRALVNVYAQDDAGPPAGEEWSGETLLNAQLLTVAGLERPDVLFGPKTTLFLGGCLPFQIGPNAEGLVLEMEASSQTAGFTIEEHLGLATATFGGDLRLADRKQLHPQDLVWPYRLEVAADTVALFALCDVSGGWETQQDPAPIDIALRIYDANNPPKDELPSQEVIDGGLVTSVDSASEPPEGCRCAGATGEHDLVIGLLFFVLWRRRR